VKLVIDPFGNEILIGQTIVDYKEGILMSDEIYDDVSRVIERPIMIFKMNNDETQLYYVRAIGWNKTMLLAVERKNGHFEVVNYEIDPPIERIAELHQKGERLL
jgi:hypothetical protein